MFKYTTVIPGHDILDLPSCVFHVFKNRDKSCRVYVYVCGVSDLTPKYMKNNVGAYILAQLKKAFVHNDF